MVQKKFINHTTHEVVELELPACPLCGSTAMRCKRPSGHEAAEWHIEREFVFAPMVGWPDWKPGDRCDDEACKDAAELAGL